MLDDSMPAETLKTLSSTDDVRPGPREVPPGHGYRVLRGVVPPEGVDRALRRIHLDLVRNGLTAEALGEWLWSAHWFPHLKWDPEIVALVDHLPDELRDGRLCDPQILLHPPDAGADQPLTPHVDQEPEWAGGKNYLRVVGFPLTRSDFRNGGLVVWPFGSSEPEALELEPGDVLVMDPQLPHTSALNRTGTIRYAVYFRYLDES
jgi:hypothetical protein